MLYMMIYLMFSFMLTTLLLLLNIFFSMNNKINREKNSPFECGFNMSSHSRLPFTMNYFIITLLFLIFDIEIMMIIPSMFMLMSFNSKLLTFTMLFFLLLLIFSLMYEWILSLLNWIFY